MTNLCFEIYKMEYMSSFKINTFVQDLNIISKIKFYKNKV